MVLNRKGVRLTVIIHEALFELVCNRAKRSLRPLAVVVLIEMELPPVHQVFPCSACREANGSITLQHGPSVAEYRPTRLRRYAGLRRAKHTHNDSTGG